MPIKEISTKFAGVIGPDVKAPLLVPSFNGGGSYTASQAGNVVTVTCTGHNIPGDAASGVSNNGVYVYLRFATAAFNPQIIDTDVVGNVAGWYGNITVIDANTFTCLAADSRTVSSTNIVPSASNIITPPGATIPGGAVEIGDTIRLFSVVIRPTLTGSRSISCRGRTKGAGNTTGIIWDTGVQTALNRVSDTFMATMTFLSNAADSTFALTTGVNSNGTTSLIKYATGLNINLSQNFTLVNSLTFNGAVANDWQMLTTISVEVIG